MTAIEPLNRKKYLRTCAPGEDSDQPAHSRSLIRNFTSRILDSQGCKVSSHDNEDTGQTARMRRLIWVFVGRTHQKVRCGSFAHRSASSIYIPCFAFWSEFSSLFLSLLRWRWRRLWCFGFSSTFWVKSISNMPNNGNKTFIILLISFYYIDIISTTETMNNA